LAVAALCFSAAALLLVVADFGRAIRCHLFWQQQSPERRASSTITAD
jgi:hypothetical protein